MFMSYVERLRFRTLAGLSFSPDLCEALAVKFEPIMNVTLESSFHGVGRRKSLPRKSHRKLA